jgi:hypothetical protein
MAYSHKNKVQCSSARLPFSIQPKKILAFQCYQPRATVLFVRNDGDISNALDLCVADTLRHSVSDIQTLAIFNFNMDSR